MTESPSTQPSTVLSSPVQDASRSDTGERNKVMTPFWKPGSGHYGNTLGKLTQSIISSQIEMVLSLLDTVPITQNDVFVLGDYGTNDGFASMPLFCSIIRRLRETHGEKLPIQIIYEDQENNDYNSLFNRLSGADSPVSLFNNVFPLVTNVQFYKQCVPDSSCHLIFAMAATHWMEKLGMSYKDNVFPVLKTEEEQCRFKEEAERDWIKFLLLRARELKPGGLLFVASPTRETTTPCENDHDTGDADEIKQDKTKDREKDLEIRYPSDTWLDLDTSWKQLRDEKKITEEEYKRCCLKVVFRTAEEVTSPFQAVTSPVRKAGLTLVHYEKVFHPCDFKTAWQQQLDTEGVDDRQSFADSMVAANQVWSHALFRTSLSDMRSEEEKAAILDNLHSKFHSVLMSKDPGSYRCGSYIFTLVVRKC